MSTCEHEPNMESVYLSRIGTSWYLCAICEKCQEHISQSLTPEKYAELTDFFDQPKM